MQIKTERVYSVTLTSTKWLNLWLDNQPWWWLINDRISNKFYQITRLTDVLRLRTNVFQTLVRLYWFKTFISSAVKSCYLLSPHLQHPAETITLSEIADIWQQFPAAAEPRWSESENANEPTTDWFRHNIQFTARPRNNKDCIFYYFTICTWFKPNWTTLCVPT